MIVLLHKQGLSRRGISWMLVRPGDVEGKGCLVLSAALLQLGWGSEMCCAGRCRLGLRSTVGLIANNSLRNHTLLLEGGSDRLAPLPWQKMDAWRQAFHPPQPYPNSGFLMTPDRFCCGPGWLRALTAFRAERTCASKCNK